MPVSRVRTEAHEIGREDDVIALSEGPQHAVDGGGDPGAVPVQRAGVDSETERSGGHVMPVDCGRTPR